VDSDVTWRRGGVSDGVGTGIAVWGGNADLRRLHVSRIYRGIRPAMDYATGVAFVEGATASTRRLRVTRVQGWGLFHSDTGVVQHDRLVAANNDNAGVWFQRGEYLQIDKSAIVGNAYAGIFAFYSDLLSISDTRVAGTREVTLAGLGTAGDGIQTVSTNADIFDTMLMLNERVGLYSWVEGPAPCLTPPEHLNIDNLRVLGIGDQLGAIFHHEANGTALIEEGVHRIGLAGRNDDAFIEDPEDLEVIAEGPAPCLLPQASLVATGGVGALLGGQQHEPPGS